MESSVYTICANQVLYVKNQEKFLVRILLVGGVLNVVLNGLLIWMGLYTPVTAVSTTLIAEIVVMGIMSVSYTHLDVYKRQVDDLLNGKDDYKEKRQKVNGLSLIHILLLWMNTGSTSKKTQH